MFYKVCILFLSLFFACKDNLSQADKDYINSINNYRIEKNYYMQHNPSSPFLAKGKIEFHNLKYYDINLDLRFKSLLNIYNEQDTIIIYGTKGEPRKTIKFGYLTFNYKKRNYKLNVYKSKYNGIDYFSIWFTDQTTNKGSYGVGRYLDFEYKDDPKFVYDIDFNLAYNPYCAYSHDYSCAIPSREDYIDLEVNAGEKIFNE